MTEFITRNLARILLGVVVLICVAGLMVVKSCSDARTAKTREKVATSQVEATQQNAKDAIGTLGARAAAEQSADNLTRSNEDAIRNAKGADAPVDAAVRDAGLAGLCRRAAYSRDPKCLRYTPAR